MLQSGSTRKYLLYAMGEIVLVVIGILIALQINNWNEWRKDMVLEKETLREIAENIEFNISVFEDFTSGGAYADYATDYVLAVLNGDMPYSDSLDRIINTAIYQRNNIEYSTLAYESLKNSNLNLIRNKDLKKEIMGLFEITYPGLSKNLEWENEKSVQDYLDHHFFPVVSARGRGTEWKPYDFDVQMADNYFKSMIAKVKIQRSYYIWVAKESMEESKRVLLLIEEALDQ